ncbi:MAG TPA: hypothetical protein ENJ88_00325 [Phaeodactylibacter sp.]|nr:hypothetical protein [Phaeodactylibacter sp.]
MKFLKFPLFLGLFAGLLIFGSCKKERLVQDVFIGTYGGVFITGDASNPQEEVGFVDVKKGGRKTYKLSSSTHPDLLPETTFTIPKDGVIAVDGGLSQSGYADDDPSLYIIMGANSAQDTISITLGHDGQAATEKFMFFLGFQL